MEHAGVEYGRAIARDGVSIAYTASGSGPALVFCHAMGVGQGMWDPHRDVFSRSHQFISFDQRGSGLSEHPPFTEGQDSFYTPEKFGEDLAAVLDELEIERASILGFSMGAVAALSFATRWPDRVERLVLASAMASRLPEEIVIRARQVEHVLDAQGLEKAYEFYFGGALFAGMEFSELLRDGHPLCPRGGSYLR
jgi:pimeloyl-ACP methyl ester carboxylesterase